MARRRTLPVLASVLALVLAAAPAAQAEPGPLERLATGILATATSGQPLEVVTTTRTSDGPRITSKVASGRSDALSMIVAALRKPLTIGVDLAHPVRTAASNDTLRSQQWALTRLGAETAWRKTTGRDVVVAVIDTGVRRDHPDLYGRVLSGYDFVNPGTPATDENGHGTHVAGVIAATAGNKRGIAGLARGARILPVRVLDKTGTGDTADVARGITWAVRHGAKVINLSLVATQSDSASRAAVAYALSKNVVVVSAAGNSGCNVLLGSPAAYPASYDGVLGVGAITQGGSVASYSNCGRYVDVVAPGSDIISTMISRSVGLGCSTGQMYCRLSGTSMATPHVAAAAALLIARLGKRASQTSVRSIIESTATDVGARGVDTRSGHGTLDVRRMLAGR